MQDINIYSESFIIMGSPATFKSNISRLLAKKLNIKLINLDREKHNFWECFTDFDEEIYIKLKNDGNKLKELKYLHDYEMQHLNYVIDNLKEPVILDFGITYSLIDNKELLNKLKLFNNIIFLKNNIEINKTIKNIITLEINVEKKCEEEVIKEIINYKEFKEVL